MGHTRLGTLPKTRKWLIVVQAISGGVSGSGSSVSISEDVGAIAAKTLEAAEGALAHAVSDEGLRFTFFLLTQVALASREQSWEKRLAANGINLPTNANAFDFAIAFQQAIDAHLLTRGGSTDISEIAQQSAGEAVAALTHGKTVTLFGGGTDALADAMRELSTKTGFSRLGQKFFGTFMARTLNFYLSREIADQVGKSRVAHVGDIKAFDEALNLHCQESARIVREFCGEWYSKTEFKEGISQRNTSGFMAVALKKLQSELMRQRALE